MRHTDLAGTHLGGYDIQKLLMEEGQGAIVATYQAHQPALKREVALQVLNPDLYADPFHRKGFVRGAEILAELEHPNIIPIHDFGEQDNLLYSAVRLMKGGTLRQRLKRQPILSPLEAAAVVRQISSALEYVHSRGRVHCDPSVANIIFDEAGNAFIADFIVAGLQDESRGLTGTPAYLAPEKWALNPASPATDQYALACITYQMITGQPPFQGDTIVLVYKHSSQPPPPPQEINPDVPKAVNEVLFRALAKSPGERYPTIMDFAREFEKAINSTPQHLFISYSRRDKTYATALTEYMKSNGFEVWIDSAIEYGDTWFKEIDEAVKTCAAFLVIMTPEAYESEWVQKEILLAKRYKKPIFPLLLQDEEFPILIDIQFADVRGGDMPGTDFHRRLRRAVFGDV